MLADKTKEELLHLDLASIHCAFNSPLVGQQIVDVHAYLGMDTNIEDKLEHLAETTARDNMEWPKVLCTHLGC